MCFTALPDCCRKREKRQTQLMPAPVYRGRIAPSPTGYLHLGHAKTFWTAYQRAKEAGGRLVYRNEDIDFQRCRPEFARAAEEDLIRLGITWDEGPFQQSKRIPLYTEALQDLARKGLVYPCPYSRAEIRQASDKTSTALGEMIFPDSLRPPLPVRVPKFPLDLSINYRFRAPDGNIIRFNDTLQGAQSFEAGKDFGDFLIWRKEGMPSYELAVVVDDIAMGITEVVRGADLLLSTARQLLLYEAFGKLPPEFCHESLVKDRSGKRLAKRSDALALRVLFENGHDLQSLRKLWNERS